MTFRYNKNIFLLWASIFLVTFFNVFLIKESFVLPVVFFIILFFIIFSIRQPKTAIILLFIAKPIIDATWFYKLPFINLNFLQINGVLFPLFAILLIYTQKIEIKRYYSFLLIALLISSTVFSFVFFLINGLQMGGNIFIKRITYGLVILFQFLNGFSSYFILPFFFNKEKDKKTLLLCFIISSLFPLITAYAQIFGLFEGRMLRTTGELMRISGLYYDSTNLRFYSMQAIIALMIYLKLYYNAINNTKKIFLLIMIVSFLYIMYLGYSKAAITILIVWTILYFLLSGNTLTSILIIASFILLYIFIPKIGYEIDKLFYKEVMYYDGTLPEELEYTLLGGRVLRWEAFLQKFINSDFLDQLFGYQFNVGLTSHNDFMRLLISNGIIGFILYFTFIIFLCFKTFITYFKYKDAISLGAVLLFISFIIDSIGLTPSIYTNYSLFVFGIISLSINRNIFNVSIQAEKENNLGYKGK